MDLLIAFGLFIAAIAFCLYFSIPISLGVLFGLGCFFGTGLHRGFSAQKLCKMIYRSRKTSYLVCGVLFFIGCLTALWRSSGTIAYLVYYGIQLITPHWFVLIAFLLSTALSIALGSSFGTVGTAGIVLMTLARSGNADLLLTAGAVLSGAFVGERCSPTSSAGLLVAAVTGMEHKNFIKECFRTGVLPFAVTFIIYAVLSWQNPIQQVDAAVVTALERCYQLSWPTLLPAVLLVLLPWFGVSIIHVIIISGIAAFVLAVGVQQQPVLTTLLECLVGYENTDPVLKSIFSGGGVLSMLNVMLVILFANCCAGIFQGTNMLLPLQQHLQPLVDKLGIFATEIVLSFFFTGVFCNQTIGITLITQLMGNFYAEQGVSREQLAVDLDNSVITIAALIPWSIACALPLAVMHVSAAVLPYSVWLYLVPLCFLCTRKKYIAGKKK